MELSPWLQIMSCQRKSPYGDDWKKAYLIAAVQGSVASRLHREMQNLGIEARCRGIGALQDNALILRLIRRWLKPLNNLIKQASHKFASRFFCPERFSSSGEADAAVLPARQVEARPLRTQWPLVGGVSE